MGIYVITIVLLLLAFAGIAIKIWAQKDGEFGKLEILQDSPVLFTKEDIPNIDYLSKTEINLVHPEYIDIYKPLIKLNE